MSDSEMTSVKQPVLIAVLVTLIFVLAIFQFFSVPSLLGHYGLSKALLMQGDLHNLELYQGYVVSELIKNKTILTLDDVWGFQSAFYQTIIGFLIALLGLLATFSVLYIRANSEEKAQESAEKYLSSEKFSSAVRGVVQVESDAKLEEINSEFNASLVKVESFIENLESVETDIATLKSSVNDQIRALSIVTRKVSELDNVENEGQDLDLDNRKES
jgi:hypothetical protein